MGPSQRTVSCGTIYQKFAMAGTEVLDNHLRAFCTVQVSDGLKHQDGANGSINLRHKHIELGSFRAPHDCYVVRMRFRGEPHEMVSSLV